MVRPVPEVMGKGSGSKAQPRLYANADSGPALLVARADHQPMALGSPSPRPARTTMIQPLV
jgi:hypothetical protein